MSSSSLSQKALSEAEQAFVHALLRFRTEIEQILGSLVTTTSTQHQPTQPVVARAGTYRIPSTKGLSQISLQVPQLVGPATLSDIFQIIAVGVKERSYDGHIFKVATEQLNNTGNTTDIGRVVDFVMVVPSIDAQLELDNAIEASTPVVSGGTVFKQSIRCRYINHKAVSTTLAGTISYFAYWYGL